jgi:hypothetical protein
LPKLALGAAAALAAISLSPGSAQAYLVTVGGTQYDVTTFTGSYNNNDSKFNSTTMPWFGSSTLANQFAAEIGAGMGYLNGGNGPFFAWQQSGIVSVWYTYQGGGGPSYGQYSGSIPVDETYVWAQVSAPAPSASAPAPLPLLGAGAAFGYSRQLRKRIKSAPGALASSLPLA